MNRKIALVTGSSRGIGRSIAIDLATKGYDVIINYLRDKEAADETLALIKEQNVNGLVIQANIGDRREVKDLVRKIKEKYEKIDVIVHSAAIGTFKDLMKIRPNQLEMAFSTNVYGLLWLAQDALPLMEESGGHIIAISSLGSQRVIPDYGIIGPSKAALESLVRYLAYELKPKGINVNCVSGGFVQTDSLYAFSHYEELVTESLLQTPGGRIAKTKDITDAVVHLISDKMDWVCGQVIIADGGASLR